MKKFILPCVLVTCALVLLTACGGPKTVGTPAPANAKVASLGEVLADPQAFEGKPVVLEGTLTGLCASLCDFTFAEGGHSVTIFMGEEKAPRVPIGQAVRVTAEVYRGEKQTVFTALGLEVLTKDGQP